MTVATLLEKLRGISENLTVWVRLADSGQDVYSSGIELFDHDKSTSTVVVCLQNPWMGTLAVAEVIAELKALPPEAELETDDGEKLSGCESSREDVGPWAPPSATEVVVIECSSL